MFSDMSSDCESYYTRENVLVGGFTCPKSDSDSTALFCCGFSDLKYCCDDPNSFFPYKYGYMWWLSLGALVGLSVAAVVLLAFIITLCVLCYLFITTKPRGLDNGLSLQAPGSPPCDCAAASIRLPPLFSAFTFINGGPEGLQPEDFAVLYSSPFLFFCINPLTAKQAGFFH
uniref:Shisa like 2A n=1 Tax=Salarias fasciatus TaxID=181472 RepID=A0A672G9X6_SALFA